MKQVLNQVLEKVNASEEELAEIDEAIEKFLNLFERKLKAKKIKAEVFLGGSFAKGTVIKKDCYDLDVFVRFEEKLGDEEMSKKLGSVLRGLKNVVVVHGSRDYFRVKLKPDLFVELVPVKKISKAEQAENITDLSYSHVSYIKKKVKDKRVLDEIKIAKAFCYAQNCYGAESYINGFSGYALELLVYNYGSFAKFLRAMTKVKGREVIDIEKHYRTKNVALMDINSSKLGSPVVLVDPTYKQRNALAALSDETFERFQKAAKKFLRSPSIKAFELEKTDLEKVEKNAKKKKLEFVLIEAKTSKQEGDVAGSKLLKFYNHLSREIEKVFEIKKKGFNYNGRQGARFYFVVKAKKEILYVGPSVKDKKNLKAFEKVHKNYITKKGRVYAKEKVVGGIGKFINDWKVKNKKKLKEMYITGLRVV